VHDPEQQPRQHQPDGHLRIDAGSAVVRAVQISHRFAQPAQIENLVDPHQHVVVGQELPQRARYEQLRLAPALEAQHAALSQV
jgi:hypothetical protein